MGLDPSSLSIFDGLTDLIPLLEDDLLKYLHKNLSEQAENAQKMVAQRTEQAYGLISIVLVPVAMLVALFVIKVLYGIYTGAADKVAQGVERAADSIRSATDRLMTSEVDNALDEDVKQNKRPVKVMRFGEIVRKYVLSSIKEETVEELVAHQKSQTLSQKIGDLMLERGLLTRTEIAQTLKIQEKQKQAKSKN